ncbi:hypothetical protein QCE80_15455, partial [Staphylococcus aureus]|nr:hypothetical protein [Staphylococcus aureus]
QYRSLFTYRRAGVRAGADRRQYGRADRDGDTERRKRPSGIAAGTERVGNRAARRQSGGWRG